MADQSIGRFARHGEKRSYRSRNNKFGILPPFARFVMGNKKRGRQGKAAIRERERERNDGCKMIDRNGFYKCPLNYWGEHEGINISSSSSSSKQADILVKKARNLCETQREQVPREIGCV